MLLYIGPLKLDEKRGGTSSILTTADHPKLLIQLCEHAAKWKDIGTYLGFSQGELEIIQTNPMLFVQGAPRSYLNYMLSEWLQWAPGDDRGSTQFATLQAFQSAMNKAGLGMAARQLHVSPCKDSKDTPHSECVPYHGEFHVLLAMTDLSVIIIFYCCIRY